MICIRNLDIFLAHQVVIYFNVNSYYYGYSTSKLMKGPVFAVCFNDAIEGTCCLKNNKTIHIGETWLQVISVLVASARNKPPLSPALAIIIYLETVNYIAFFFRYTDVRQC